MTNYFEGQPKHVSVLIVGGGQAGLSASYYLQQQNIDHVIIEADTAMNAWYKRRWDSFTLVTPNWQCDLPDHPYDGDDPHGFMNLPQVQRYLQAFRDKVNPPIIEHTKVTAVNEINGTYHIQTTGTEYTANHVIVAAGGYHSPIIPPMAARLEQQICQIHSEQYRNAQQLPEGAVLVVGSGQSGAQIAEDLHLAGKKVYLAVGNAPRCARFYRGRDVVAWLDEMDYYKITVDEHPLREGVRDNTNHYVTGRDGGRDIDLRQFATEGMELFGTLKDFDGENLQFAPNLSANLEAADATYNNINQRIDAYIRLNNIDAPPASRYDPVWQPEQERTVVNLKQAGITAVVWSIGFKPDFSWLNIAAFNGAGRPMHFRGVCDQQGLYFLGLPWLNTWGSGRFSGINEDAHYLVETIAQREAQSHRRRA